MAKCNLGKVNLMSMQPAVSPIGICDLQGDLNSLELASLPVCFVVMQLVLEVHLMYLADLCTDLWQPIYKQFLIFYELLQILALSPPALMIHRFL